jgi:hypothetical protein
MSEGLFGPIDYPQGFKYFWDAYPRKVAKTDAWKAWRKQGCEWSDAMRMALKRWSAEWRDPKFIPYPATFLNRRQWEDEPVKTVAQENRDAIDRAVERRAHRVGPAVQPKTR